MRRPHLGFRLCLCVAALVLFSMPTQAADKTKQADDAQDFVFLAEARPVLVRLHVRVDGKPLRATWDEFMKYLFNYLDTNRDGVLSKEEAERAPSPQQILTGGL